MLEEVSSSSTRAYQLQLTRIRIYMRLLGLGWLRRGDAGQSILGYGRTLFQPGRQATGRQLDLAETGTTGGTDLARLVGIFLEGTGRQDIVSKLDVGPSSRPRAARLSGLILP